MAGEADRLQQLTQEGVSAEHLVEEAMAGGMYHDAVGQDALWVCVSPFLHLDGQLSLRFPCVCDHGKGLREEQHLQFLQAWQEEGVCEGPW